MLTVTSAASDTSLLTLTELRSATGAATGYADELTVLGERVAAALARACRLAAVEGVVPTFRLETLTEVFRLREEACFLLLARRPVMSIVSVNEYGTDLTSAYWELDQGMLYRMDGQDWRVEWPETKITVSYTAGWSTVPDDLKLAASKLARILWTEDGPGSREPGLKREKTDGVDEREYWVAPASDPLLSAEIAELLVPYINYGV